MDLIDFKSELFNRRFVQLGDYFIFNNLEIYDSVSGRSIYFGSLDALLHYKIDSYSVESHIYNLRAGDVG